MKIFDSHTHLNNTPFAGNEAYYVKHAAELDVKRMAIVGSDAELNAGAIRLAKQFDNLYAIVGWHPEFAKDYNQTIEDQLITQLQNKKTVALGEIGLDYHWNTSPHDQQQNVFRRQLDIAEQLHLPVAIHTRDALADTYQILRDAKLTYGGIIHSFNGSKEWAQKFLDLGMYLSFSGVVSFKNAPLVHEAAQMVPLDRMLVETDAPYLTPVPYRGHQNEPGYTHYVVAAIAKLRNVDMETIAQHTWHNANQIYGLSENED